MDFAGIAAAGASAASGLIGQFVESPASTKARHTQEEQYWNDYAFQREQYEYQKQLQEQLIQREDAQINRAYAREDQQRALQMNREDTAVQRNVADMRAAGLSPLAQAQQASTGNLLGSGQIGSMGSNPVSFGTPASYVERKTMDFSSIANAVNTYQQAQSNQLANERQALEVDVAKLAYQRELATFQSSIDRYLNETAQGKLLLDRLLRDEEWCKKNGIYPSMTEKERLAAAGTAVVSDMLTGEDNTGVVGKVKGAVKKRLAAESPVDKVLGLKTPKAYNIVTADDPLEELKTEFSDYAASLKELGSKAKDKGSKAVDYLSDKAKKAKSALWKKLGWD